MGLDVRPRVDQREMALPSGRSGPAAPILDRLHCGPLDPIPTEKNPRCRKADSKAPTPTSPPKT